MAKKQPAARSKRNAQPPAKPAKRKPPKKKPQKRAPRRSKRDQTIDAILGAVRKRLERGERVLFSYPDGQADEPDDRQNTQGEAIAKGRPLELTPALIDEMESALMDGQPIKRVCRGSGITYQTFRNWCLRGREGEEPFASFLDRIKKALCRGERQQLARVCMGTEEWQSGAWWLERKFHEEWGRRPQVAMQVVNVQNAAVHQARLELQAAVCPALMSEENRQLIERLRQKQLPSHSKVIDVEAEPSRKVG